MYGGYGALCRWSTGCFTKENESKPEKTFDTKGNHCELRPPIRFMVGPPSRVRRGRRERGDVAFVTQRLSVASRAAVEQSMAQEAAAALGLSVAADRTRVCAVRGGL